MIAPRYIVALLPPAGLELQRNVLNKDYLDERRLNKKAS
jgi:hypothetical protein